MEIFEVLNELLNIPAIIASMGGLSGLLIIYFIVKKVIKKVTSFIELTSTLYRRYREKVVAILDTDVAIVDYKLWLKSLDEATEAIADLCSKLHFVPKKFILKMRNFIKEIHYKENI